jgi:hypothetical protein
MHNTDLAIISGGLTSDLQTLDMSVKKTDENFPMTEMEYMDVQ